MTKKDVSIIIPCRNEVKYISKCLDSIIACEYPKGRIEVLVCDGMSEDGTQEIIQSYAERYDFIKLLINEHKTTPQALNLGIKQSEADKRMILGAHAEIYPDYIANSLEEFEKDPRIGCVGGIIESVYDDKISRLISHVMTSKFGVGNAHFRTGEKNGDVDTVAFGTYKKEVFDKVGYFDDELIRNQDDEFNFRVIRAGYRIVLQDTIRSKYYVRGSIEKLFRQFSQYGYWKVFVNKKHKTITSLRQLAPMFFLLFLFFGITFSFIWSTVFYILLAMLSVYVLTGLFNGLLLTSSVKQMFTVMYIYFILHMSYGMGYLEGMINFLLFNNRPDKKNTELSR